MYVCYLFRTWPSCILGYLNAVNPDLDHYLIHLNNKYKTPCSCIELEGLPVLSIIHVVKNKTTIIQGVVIERALVL